MFEWYRNAEICVAYLEDVESVNGNEEFEQGEWFRKDWTLQELLAPQMVLFVTKTWEIIGNKGAMAHARSKYLSLVGPSLEDDLAKVTHIPAHTPKDYGSSLACNIDERLRWMMRGRTTTREENVFYALYGILGTNYGERHEGARHRLMVANREEEDATAQHQEHLHDNNSWLKPPDPYTNHKGCSPPTRTPDRRLAVTG